jgi:mRNA interferase HigB
MLTHPESRSKLQGWVQAVEQTSATNFSDLKLAFRRADYVPKEFTVFDVGGNNYRVVTVIHFQTQRVYVHHVFTHAEYDKWTKENRKK